MMGWARVFRSFVLGLSGLRLCGRSRVFAINSLILARGDLRGGVCGGVKRKGLPRSTVAREGEQLPDR